MIQPAKRLEAVSTYYFAKKLKQIADMNAAGKQVINLGIGSPDLTPPPSVCQQLIEGLESKNAHQYQSYYGLPELRNAFSDFYNNKFSVALDVDQEILPLIGSKEGIMHIAMTYLEQGDQVLVPDPGYPSYRMTTLLAGAEPINYNLTESNQWMPDFEALNQLDLKRVKLMWVNYPNMPTGANASKKLFEQLIAFGRQHNILICHDNPYSFILNEEPLSILSVDGAMEHAVELISLSKSFNMAGWRVGAVCGNAIHISNIIKFKSNMDSGMFKPIQLAAVEALKCDSNWFDNLNAIYAKRKRVAARIFDLINVQYDLQSCGLFLWGRTEFPSSEVLSEKILEEANVFITPGKIFGKNGAAYLRISLCSPEAVLEEALQRIKNIL